MNLKLNVGHKRQIIRHMLPGFHNVLLWIESSRYASLQVELFTKGG